MNWILGLVVSFSFLAYLASLVVVTWALTKTTWEAQRRQADMECQLAGKPPPAPEPSMRPMPERTGLSPEQMVERMFDSQVT